jgi:myosin-5
MVTQLQSAGVSTSIEISHASLPFRVPYADFASRYRMLLPSREPDEKTAAQRIVTHIDTTAPTGVRFGTTKVFFDRAFHTKLESARLCRLATAAATLQSQWRMMKSVQHFQQLKKAALILQQVWRQRVLSVAAKSELARRQYAAKLQSAAVIVQQQWRRRVLRRRTTALVLKVERRFLHTTVVVLQRAWRAHMHAQNAAAVLAAARVAPAVSAEKTIEPKNILRFVSRAVFSQFHMATPV